MYKSTTLFMIAKILKQVLSFMAKTVLVCLHYEYNVALKKKTDVEISGLRQQIEHI